MVNLDGNINGWTGTIEELQRNFKRELPMLLNVIYEKLNWEMGVPG